MLSMDELQMKISECLSNRVSCNNYINYEATRSSGSYVKETNDTEGNTSTVKDIIDISPGNLISNNEPDNNSQALVVYTNRNIACINDSTSQLSIPFVSSSRQQASRNIACCVLKEMLKLFFATSVGAGMMPIISNSVYKLENYGIYINDTEPLLVTSTINTMGIYGLLGYMKISGLLDVDNEPHQELTSCQKLMLHGSKIASVLSSALPITQLWQIELNNQAIADSSGFDEYIIWAIICTIPLLIYRTIKAYKALEKRICGNATPVPLDSAGQRIFTIGVSILAQIARSIIYTYSVSELASRSGLSEELSFVIGIICGGIIASSVIGMMEFSSLKSLFKRQEDSPTFKELALGALCIAEASWFTLPLMSTSADSLKDCNLLVKSALLTSLFISHTAKEANSMYHSVNSRTSERTSRHNISA